MLFLKEISSFTWMPIQTKGDATMYNTIGTFLAAIQYFPIRKRKVGKEGARWKLLFRRHFETPSLLCY